VRDTDVVNICFHGIGMPQRQLESGEESYWVSPDQFRSILDEVAAWPAVALSFDDSNSSDVEIALPALEERNLNATFFVLAGRLGTRGSLQPGDLAELRKRGMAIGSHGMAHRPWRDMPGPMREAELIEARTRIAEAVGTPVYEVACPLGRYDRQLLNELRRLGYRRVYTSDRRVARRDAWLQPRFSVHHGDTPSFLANEVRSSQTVLQSTKASMVGLLKRLR
jgi:peptidoglycan/xylan/chitin deacetylase (PgdA/CDA1 family)